MAPGSSISGNSKKDLIFSRTKTLSRSSNRWGVLVTKGLGREAELLGEGVKKKLRLAGYEEGVPRLLATLQDVRLLSIKDDAELPGKSSRFKASSWGEFGDSSSAPIHLAYFKEALPGMCTELIS